MALTMASTRAPAVFMTNAGWIAMVSTRGWVIGQTRVIKCMLIPTPPSMIYAPNAYRGGRRGNIIQKCYSKKLVKKG